MKLKWVTHMVGSWENLVRYLINEENEVPQRHDLLDATLLVLGRLDFVKNTLKENIYKSSSFE